MKAKLTLVHTADSTHPYIAPLVDPLFAFGKKRDEEILLYDLNTYFCLI